MRNPRQSAIGVFITSKYEQVLLQLWQEVEYYTQHFLFLQLEDAKLICNFFARSCLANDKCYVKSFSEIKNYCFRFSAQITSALITELGDKNWKVRGEALQKVTQPCGLRTRVRYLVYQKYLQCKSLMPALTVLCTRSQTYCLLQSSSLQSQENYHLHLRRDLVTLIRIW